MNITGSTSIPLVTNQSILKTANEQPELALQLLQESLAGLTPPTSHEDSNVASPTPPQIGLRIVIRV